MTSFGTANKVSVTEDPNVYYLVGDIQCTSAGGNGTNNNTIDIGAQNVVILLEEGEFVTCTFMNDRKVPTASSATIEGVISDKSGGGVGNVVIYLSSMDGVLNSRAITNPYGYYKFVEIPAGNSYVLTLTAKGYTFSPASTVINVNDNIVDLNFVATKDQSPFGP